MVNKETIAGILPKEKASLIGMSTSNRKGAKSIQKIETKKVDKNTAILKATHHHKMKKICLLYTSDAADE